MDITEEEKARIREKVEKLKNSRFKQQTLPAWRPIPSFRSTMITFTVFGIIFLALGIILYVMSDQIQEVSQQYDTNCTTLGTFCSVTITINQTITAPVYVYYQLDNFYQNHRRYVKSRSYEQLKGTYLAVSSLTDCDPITKNSDISTTLKAVNGSLLDQNGPATPCGLVAKSYFTDDYNLTNTATPTVNVTINQANIAWESDKTYKFANLYKNLPSGYDWQAIQWIDMTNEHFIVWMRTAGLPNFRKLWGKIETDLPAGTYTLGINNNYDVSAFEGKKTFVLSTTNALGGKNYFLAICYIVVGSLCIVFAIIFLIAFLRKRNARRND